MMTFASAASNLNAETDFAFQLRKHRLPAFKAQFPFAAPMGRKYLADFCFVNYQLIIEIQGGVWMPGGGAHSRPSNIQRDIEKQQHAVLLGYFVLPFQPEDVRSEKAIQWTIRALHTMGWKR